MTANQPDNTAIRTALLRALHVLIDATPYVIEDKIGYQLIKPERDWQERPDTLEIKIIFSTFSNIS
jgi:hypothetical protein